LSLPSTSPHVTLAFPLEGWLALALGTAALAGVTVACCFARRRKKKKVAASEEEAHLQDGVAPMADLRMVGSVNDEDLEGALSGQREDRVANGQLFDVLVAPPPVAPPIIGRPKKMVRRVPVREDAFEVVVGPPPVKPPITEPPKRIFRGGPAPAVPIVRGREPQEYQEYRYNPDDFILPLPTGLSSFYQQAMQQPYDDYNVQHWQRNPILERGGAAESSPASAIAVGFDDMPELEAPDDPTPQHRAAAARAEDLQAAARDIMMQPPPVAARGAAARRPGTAVRNGNARRAGGGRRGR